MRIGRRLAIGATAMTVELTSKLHQLRRTNRDWLLTLLTAVLALMIFVFAPLQGKHSPRTADSVKHNS
jgi:multidrug resistance efflux pump